MLTRKCVIGIRIYTIVVTDNTSEPVLVLPAAVCSGCAVWRIQPHLAADRDRRTVARQRVQKNVRW